MFGIVRFRYQLWKFERQGRSLSKAYDSDREKARRRGATADEMRSINESEMDELGMNHEQIMDAHTKRLTEIGYRLMIPVPSAWDTQDADKWEDGKLVYKYLSKKGLAELRASIRAERKARWELVVMWVPLFTLVVGLIGTVTGLVAVLNRGQGH
jgi:hypothetical protein